MEEPDFIYRVTVYLPPEFLEEMMDGIDGIVTSVYSGYTRCFNYRECTGTWRSEEGSHPYDGTPGMVTVAEEIELSFICLEKDLESAVDTIRRIHPYEEPALDIVRMVAWKSVSKRLSS